MFSKFGKLLMLLLPILMLHLGVVDAEEQLNKNDPASRCDVALQLQNPKRS
jgi:hypothetical protein